MKIQLSDHFTYKTLLRFTLHGFFIFSFSFLFSGIAIYISSFFTALNDGLTSALISFLRTLVFQIAAVLIFPLIWKIDGIWFSVVAAEIMAAAVSIVLLIAKKKFAKRNGEQGTSPFAKGEEGSAPSTAPPFEKGGRKLLVIFLSPFSS